MNKEYVALVLFSKSQKWQKKPINFMDHMGTDLFYAFRIEQIAPNWVYLCDTNGNALW